MGCNHKFLEDLNLENLDFNPEVLIVGTFNPQWPASNSAGWFYGRTQNNYFWDVLPRLYGEESLLKASAVEWKEFCKRNKIGITDMVACVADADPTKERDCAVMGNYSDEGLLDTFKSFEFVQVLNILKRYPDIRRVYFTRGIGDPFWANKWKVIADYVHAHGGVATTLLTPSRNAFYRLAHSNNMHLDMRVELKDYILENWEKAGIGKDSLVV